MHRTRLRGVGPELSANPWNNVHGCEEDIWPTFRFIGCWPIFPEERSREEQTRPGWIAKVNLSPGIVTFLANRDKVRPHNAAPPLTLLYPIRRAMNAKNGIVRLGKSKSSLGRRLTHLCVRI